MHLHLLPDARVLNSVWVVVIESDGVRCDGRGPFALPLCVCVVVCSCVVLHVGLWNASALSRLPCGGGGLHRWGQQSGYQERPGARLGSTRCALESVFVCQHILHFFFTYTLSPANY